MFVAYWSGCEVGDIRTAELKDIVKSGNRFLVKTMVTAPNIFYQKKAAHDWTAFSILDIPKQVRN